MQITPSNCFHLEIFREMHKVLFFSEARLPRKHLNHLHQLHPNPVFEGKNDSSRQLRTCVVTLVKPVKLLQMTTSHVGTALQVGFLESFLGGEWVANLGLW